ncbi:MAG: hypothetical protein EBZ36_16455 [Acidobacteria bacterium]|nr:hypothetical protein [Acidobacteriota bacterium]
MTVFDSVAARPVRSTRSGARCAAEPAGQLYRFRDEAGKIEAARVAWSLILNVDDVFRRESGNRLSCPAYDLDLEIGDRS